MAKDPLQDAIERTVEEETVEFPGGLLTLQKKKGARPLPPYSNDGRRPVLIDLVLYNQDLYNEFLTLIRTGSYFHVAAEAIGISERTFRSWISQGSEDAKADEDTFFSRFYYDIRRATALCRADRERKIAETDPKTWLSKGPGRMFGNEWGKQETREVEREQDAIEGIIIKQQQIEVQQESKIELDAKEQLEAIEAMEAAGQGTYSKEYKNALRQKAGLPLIED